MFALEPLAGTPFSNTPQYAQLMHDQWAQKQAVRDKRAAEHREASRRADLEGRTLACNTSKEA